MQLVKITLNKINTEVNTFEHNATKSKYLIKYSLKVSLPSVSYAAFMRPSGTGEHPNQEVVLPSCSCSWAFSEGKFGIFTSPNKKTFWEQINQK